MTRVSRKELKRRDSIGKVDERATVLSFYDHHRQSYGAMPIRDGADAEFMIGDYGEPGENQGCGPGGEFAVALIRLSSGSDLRGHRYLAPQLRVFHDATGSLHAFLESGAWDLICKTAEDKAILTRDDMTALLLGAGLHDRSDHPVGHQPVCHCCNRPVNP